VNDLEHTVGTVDITVQDYFFSKTSEGSPPISEDTWTDWFQAWLTDLQPDLSPQGAYELSLRLTDDAEIRAFNAEYRQVDEATDVLAFAALEGEQPPTPDWVEATVYLGDLIISVETAQRQSALHNHTLVQELAWLASHGLLHLLGWDHPDDDSLCQMLERQHDLLFKTGVFPSDSANVPYKTFIKLYQGVG
jgi:probable rRNA maturation factor